MFVTQPFRQRLVEFLSPPQLVTGNCENTASVLPHFHCSCCVVQLAAETYTVMSVSLLHSKCDRSLSPVLAGQWQ